MTGGERRIEKLPTADEKLETASSPCSEPFDDDVIDEIAERLEDVPEEDHDETIEQFLFDHYYGSVEDENSLESTVEEQDDSTELYGPYFTEDEDDNLSEVNPAEDEDGYISHNGLIELVVSARMIEITLANRTTDFTPCSDGPTPAAMVIEKNLHLCLWLIQKWDSYKNEHNSQQNINELRELYCQLILCAREFTGERIKYTYHTVFGGITRSVTQLMHLLPAPGSSQTNTQPSSKE